MWIIRFDWLIALYIFISLVRNASFIIVKESGVREELSDVVFFLHTKLQHITVKEHLFDKFALAPLNFGPCTSPNETFPFIYHFPSVSIPIRHPLKCRPIWAVENFQCFQLQIGILDNPCWRRCSHLDPHIRFSTLEISFGVDKLKRMLLSSSSVPSQSIKKRLKTQWKWKLCKMSLLRLLSKGINSGILSTGRP